MCICFCCQCLWNQQNFKYLRWKFYRHIMILDFKVNSFAKNQGACASEMAEYFAGLFTFIAQFRVCVHKSKQDHSFASLPHSTVVKNISSQMQVVLVWIWTPWSFMELGKVTQPQSTMLIFLFFSLFVFFEMGFVCVTVLTFLALTL